MVLGKDSDRLMKILLMHQSDGQMGGGQVQMQRLYSGLKKHGVNAKTLCRKKSLDDSVLMPSSPRLEKCIGKFTRRLGFNDIHLISSFAVPTLAEYIDADLVDIHCLHSGTFSHMALPALTADKPTVFTFHDMWPITGHCHTSLECGRWRTGCGSCPHLEIYPEVRRDATAIEWRMKRRAYERSRFTIVTPSRWLHDRVRQSMLARFPVHHIPHGVETDVFRPLDRLHCRDILGIPKNKNVLICAQESMLRPLKGADLLVEAIQTFPKSLQRDSVLILFGEPCGKMISQIPMPVYNLGYLHNNHLKALAFSAADLFINPTRAESFGLAVLESMACGTPVVAFDVGGVPELVRPGVTGYLAAPNQALDLSNSVVRLLDDRSELANMANRCRQIAVSEYSLDLQVQRYIKLYAQVIQEKRTSPCVPRELS